MYCVYCGKEIPDESKFCGYCGKVAFRPGDVTQPQEVTAPLEVAPPPRIGTAPTLPDSNPTRDIPSQASITTGPEKMSEGTPQPKGRVNAATISIALVLLIAALAVISNIKEKDTGAVKQVQNGYLGGYDDVTIDELLTYSFEGFDITWDGWAPDSKTYIVEVRIDDGDKSTDSDVIQFEADNKGLFRLSGIKASGLDASNRAEVMQYMNQLYYQYYLLKALIDDFDADDSKILERMGDMPFGAVMYGTPADYKGNRLDACLSRATDTEKKYTVGEMMGWSQQDESNLLDPSSGATTQYSAYDYIISQYTTALREGWDSVQLMEAGLNYMCSYHWDPSEIGYALLDINNNGTKELIIGEVGDSGAYSGGSGFFYDLYTLIGDQAVLVASSTERDRYYICNNGYIENDGSDGASDSYDVYYQFHRDGYLLIEDVLVFDAQFVANGSWSHSIYSTMPSDRSYISDEEAYRIMDKYKRMPIRFTPFV